jgi:hypothetical protein
VYVDEKRERKREWDIEERTVINDSYSYKEK